MKYTLLNSLILLIKTNKIIKQFDNKMEYLVLFKEILFIKK